MSRQPSQTFRNPNGFFALQFSFPAKPGQIPAGKNWQISIRLWVINSEKRAVSKPVLYVVLVSVSVAINNRNWKYLGWLQHPFLFSCHSEIWSNTDLLEIIYTYQSLCLTSWRTQATSCTLQFAQLVLQKHSPAQDCPPQTITDLTWGCFHSLKGTTHSKRLLQTLSKQSWCALYFLISKRLCKASQSLPKAKPWGSIIVLFATFFFCCVYHAQRCQKATNKPRQRVSRGEV